MFFTSLQALYQTASADFGNTFLDFVQNTRKFFKIFICRTLKSHTRNSRWSPYSNSRMIRKFHRIAKFFHTLTFSTTSFLLIIFLIFLIKHFEMITLWMLGRDWCSFLIAEYIWKAEQIIKHFQSNSLGFLISAEFCVCARNLKKKKKGGKFIRVGLGTIHKSHHNFKCLYEHKRLSQWWSTCKRKTFLYFKLGSTFTVSVNKMVRNEQCFSQFIIQQFISLDWPKSVQFVSFSDPLSFIIIHNKRNESSNLLTPYQSFKNVSKKASAKKKIQTSCECFW